MTNKLRHELLSKEKLGNVSDKYAPVNTQLFVEPFITRGWTPKSTYNVTNRKTGIVHKEVITLVNPDFKTVHGDIELKVVNSYDARSSLRIYAGIHRLVCSNGLIMMVEGEQFRFIHRGTAIYEQLDNAYDKIVAYLETVKNRTERLSNTVLTLDEQSTLALNIAKSLFEKDTKREKVTVLNISPQIVKQLLRVRRIADKENDAFTILNRLQENITRFGNLTALVEIKNKETNEARIEFKSKHATENRNIIKDIEINQVITSETLKLIA